MNVPLRETFRTPTDCTYSSPDNHSHSQPRFETPRSEFEHPESQPRKPNLPSFSELWDPLYDYFTVGFSCPIGMVPSSRYAQYGHHKPPLPMSCLECTGTGRPLTPLTRPHSAPARYEPYTLLQPSKSLSPRTFVDQRDIEQYSHHPDVKRIGSRLHDREQYPRYTGFGYRCPHSLPARSSDFGDCATPRPYTDSAVLHCVKAYGCPCGACPVREHHCSNRVGRYLNVPELPSRRGSWRNRAHYPASHDDRQSTQVYTPRDLRPSQPQARSVEHFDDLKSFSGYTHSDQCPDCSEGEDEEPVCGDECGSSLKVNPQPSEHPIPDEWWMKHCTNLRKDKRTGANVYRCHYPVVKDNLPATPCNQEGAKSTIKRHFDTVHLRIRNFECTICPIDPCNGPKAFGQRQGLRVHINAVHREIGPYIPFLCKHCPEKFAHPSQRNKHCKSQHPEVEIKKRRKLPYR